MYIGDHQVEVEHPEVIEARARALAAVEQAKAEAAESKRQADEAQKLVQLSQVLGDSTLGLPGFPAVAPENAKFKAKLKEARDLLFAALEKELQNA